MSGTLWPAEYEIRVEGALDDRWSEWFDRLRIENQKGEAILSGVLDDQASLNGVLERIRDVGLPLIAVRRIEPEERGSG